MTRTALLIGVASTPGAPDFDPLDDSVAADLAGLREALESSGYDVQVLENAGRAQIGTKIFEIAKQVPDEGTFLVYFTGHGVRLDDVDYLLPADALAPPDGDWSPVYRDSLQSADISRYLEQCRAGTVLWLIDACRDAVTGSAFGSRIVHGPPTGGFALIVGCDLGERCGYSASGSFFTQGLIEAFSSMSAPQTVHEVFESARSVTSRLAARHGLKQRIQIRYGTDREVQTRDTRVCEGRHLMDEWRAAVVDDRLWRLAAPSDEVPRLQQHLLSLVEACARQVQNAEKRRRDPWTDDDFAPRLLLRTLPLITPEEAAFSAIEVCALIAAVFLHEGAWADKLSQASEASPWTRRRKQDASVHRRHLEQVHDQYAHISRKLDSLRYGTEFDELIEVAQWLVHRWIAERFETDVRPVPHDLVSEFARDVLGAADTGRLEEFVGALSRLAVSVGTEPPLDASPDCGARKIVLASEKQLFRERPLAALLRVAGVLAVDARVFPDVVAEHLAVSDAVSPADVVATVRRSVHWSRDGSALDMDATCPHQALHAGLEEVVERADRLAAQTKKSAESLPETESVLLTRIPARVTAGELRPRQTDGQKAYEVPLLRFQLAQNEVRDLLMGKQLYGKPDLALRELYQNAMDACRYRAMRWEYLRRLGKHPIAWEGQIRIVRGEDERGRYVECRDNGVGMGWDQLINTFTRAGSRFEQSRLFRQEQAAWLRFDPALRLYPNSRFGIGVFSYFMLADEMIIVTRPVSRDGVPAQDAWRVEISSSGSLFRILKHTERNDGVAEGGTRVRLYLRDSSDVRNLSCSQTLGSLVAVSEFQLEVDDGARTLRWEPGVLYPLRANRSKSCHTAVPGVLWWVSGEGAILCDGIVTDKKPFGYVLNLTGAHAGELSVNRKELLSYDWDWERQTWARGAAAARTWPDLTMNWLWSLDTNNLPVARLIWQSLQGKGVQVREEQSGIAYDIDSTGVTLLDSEVVRHSREYSERGVKRYFLPWRAAVLRRSYFGESASAPRSLAGHPLVEPGDAEIALGKRGGDLWADTPERSLQDWRAMIKEASQRDMTVAEIVRSLRRSRIVHPRFAPPRVSAGDLDWRPDYTDSSLVDLLLGHADGRAMAGPEDLRDLVVASHRLYIPLGELVRRCTRYTPLRLASPPEVPPHHEEYVCTNEDLAMLYLVEVEERPFGEPKRTTTRVEHPGDVGVAAERADVPADTVVERLAQFSWLGWDVPDAEAVVRWLDIDEPAYSLLREYSNADQTLDWVATVALASEEGLTLEEAEGELDELAELTGLRYTSRLNIESINADLIPSEEVAIFLAKAYKEGRADLVHGFTMQDLAYYSPLELHHVYELVEELAEIGIAAPSYPLLHEAWDDLPLRSRYAFSGHEPNIEGNDFPTEPTACVLFVASSELKEPLSDMWKLARKEASRFDMTVPVLPKALAEFRPSWDEVDALVNVEGHDGGGWDPTPEWVPLSMAGLAKYAHETKLNGHAAYERLASLRPLGALVPELSPEALRVLENSMPDARDLVALGGGHRVTGPDEPLVALDLVSVAARLGETISDTWHRFVPYLPLTVEPAVSHIPEVIPHWQDLAILTKYLDGRLPAIEGRVDPAHVEFVAGEVGESQEWVWGRLKLYETMFALDLSDMPEEG